jgi:hypothetical protein
MRPVMDLHETGDQALTYQEFCSIEFVLVCKFSPGLHLRGLNKIYEGFIVVFEQARETLHIKIKEGHLH